MTSLSTAGRAHALATAARPFTGLLGPITADDLLDLVRVELGHGAFLDSFQTHGTHLARAIPPRTVLHVISGNTPHAGLQSLMRGLLLGSHNLCKLPSSNLVPEIAQFVALLPPTLGSTVELSESLADSWLERADAVVVFGSDETIRTLRPRVRDDAIFIPHGHRISIGVVLDDPACASVETAAHVTALFDQAGCLSPQGFYVRGDAREYAAKLAGALEREQSANPRGAIPPDTSAALTDWREEWRFRAANDPGHLALWTSPGSTAWTVLFDGGEAGFTSSPLSRTVIVRPLPDDLRSSLALARPFLSTIGLWPATRGNADWIVARDLGASRLCPLDRMQLPPLTWHQDGIAPLTSLMRWVDFEPGL